MGHILKQRRKNSKHLRKENAGEYKFLNRAIRHNRLTVIPTEWRYLTVEQ